MELPMSDTNIVSPLRRRMIEDMTARKLTFTHTAQSPAKLQAVRGLA